MYAKFYPALLIAGGGKLVFWISNTITSQEIAMYVTIETIITIGKVLGALGVIGGIVWKLFQWVNHQKEQDQKIEELIEQHKKDIDAVRADYNQQILDLKTHHDKDIADIKSDNSSAMEAIQAEQTLVVYGLLACLKGLAEQGCDGPVAVAIDKIEKHINNRAHSR